MPLNGVRGKSSEVVMGDVVAILSVFFFLVVLPMAGLALYFLPAIIAFRRNHNNRAAILVLDLLTAWTFIGWAISLVWSFTSNTGKVAKVTAALALIYLAPLHAHAVTPILDTLPRCQEAYTNAAQQRAEFESLYYENKDARELAEDELAASEEERALLEHQNKTLQLKVRALNKRLRQRR